MRIEIKSLTFHNLTLWFTKKLDRGVLFQYASKSTSKYWREFLESSSSLI